MTWHPPPSCGTSVATAADVGRDAGALLSRTTGRANDRSYRRLGLLPPLVRRPTSAATLKEVMAFQTSGGVRESIRLGRHQTLAAST